MHPDVCRFISRGGVRGPPDARIQSCAAPVDGRRHGHPLPARRACRQRSSDRPRRPSDRARDRRLLAAVRTPIERGDRVRSPPPTSWSSRRTTHRSGCFAGALPAGRPHRHRRQLPGPGGAGRALLDGDVERRGRAPRHRVPVQPQPAERRDQPRPLPRLSGLRPGAPRDAARSARRDAARSRRCARSSRRPSGSAEPRRRRRSCGAGNVVVLSRSR